jgi:protein-tyrosine kinase
MSSIEKAVERLKRSSTEPTEVLDLQDKSDQRRPPGELNRKNNILYIDMERLGQLGFLTTAETDRKRLEEFRILKRPILDNAFGKLAAIEPNGNVIMITSSIAGEGKTFTTLSLAMSIAQERDTTVLLVDCDVINPSLSMCLGVQDYRGLTDILLDSDITLGDVIINTDVPQLRVLPSGSPHPQSTELLASEKMAMLVQDLSQRYSDRIVLFDSPPLLLASQAAVLSQLMGQIIVVVEAEKTPQQVVKDAIDLLDNDKAIGIVLNKTRKSGIGGYYGSYYGTSET